LDVLSAEKFAKLSAREMCVVLQGKFEYLRSQKRFETEETKLEEHWF